MTRERSSGRGKKKLPRLAFGNQNPQTDTSAKAMSERVQSVLPWEVSYQAIGNEQDFEHQLSTVSINGLRVVATASTPIKANIADARDATLMIPMSGASVSALDGHQYEWIADKSACLMPKVSRDGFSSGRSALMLDIDPVRLKQTLQAMSGNAKDVAIDLESPQSLPLQAGAINFTQAYQNICGLIVSIKSDQKLLDSSGLDDLLYRLTVMLLRPDIFCVDQANQPKTRVLRSLDQICQYILVNLTKRITMTELELVSGLSVRSLQTQFQKQFSCTPMQWITQRRLDACNQQLKTSVSKETVTSIALHFGFTNLGNFARMYAERFGELPSKTLKNN